MQILCAMPKFHIKYYLKTLGMHFNSFYYAYLFIFSKARKSKPRHSSSPGFAYRNFNVGELLSLCVSPKLSKL